MGVNVGAALGRLASQPSTGSERRWRGWTGVLTLLAALWLFPGCAALGPRTEGVSGPVAWQATNLARTKKLIGTVERDVYSFTLVLRETAGSDIAFTRFEYSVYQPDAGHQTRELNGRWRLQPHGELRWPFESFLTCPSLRGCSGPTAPTPLWKFTLTGHDERGQKRQVAIDVTLPADPLVVQAVATRPAAAAISPAPPAGPAATMSRETKSAAVPLSERSSLLHS